MIHDPASPAPAVRLVSPAVVVLYAAALSQGLTLVSFPALSGVLKESYGFTNAAYGAIFLPQLIFAILGAILGGSYARTLGLRLLLTISLLTNALSLGLVASLTLLPGSLAFPAVLLATGIFGLGFGLTGAPINTLPPLLFPRQPYASVIAAHTLIGFGLALGPLIAGQLVAAGVWVGLPLMLVVMSLVLAMATLVSHLPRGERQAASNKDTPARTPASSPLFWIFVMVAVLYAFAEGTFANWAILYLGEVKGLPETTASTALSVFWGALVVGRLTISAAVTRLPPSLFWMLLPVLMIAAFLLLPTVNSALSGILMFGFAGLACSAFFPLTITLAAARFPGDGAWVASMLIAALMVGVGIGSFMIGALREMLRLETLYQVSAVYPFAVLLLGVLVLRRRQPEPAPAPSR